jgi:hypothetical protein
MVHYFLPSHAHFCERDDQFIFLDLRTDGYFLLKPEEAQALRSLLEGDLANERHSDLATPLKSLVEAGLLVTDEHLGRPLAPADLEIARTKLIDPEGITRVDLTARDVLNFALACAVAFLRLRVTHIQSTVRLVERRRRAATATPFDIDKARALTSVFYKLRCLFPVNYLCLYDSLALILFLSKYGVFPKWIFGVRLEPWEAHCWVQQESILFNDEPEEVADYEAIMAV